MELRLNFDIMQIAKKITLKSMQLSLFAFSMIVMPSLNEATLFEEPWGAYLLSLHFLSRMNQVFLILKS